MANRYLDVDLFMLDEQNQTQCVSARVGINNPTISDATALGNAERDLSKMMHDVLLEKGHTFVKWVAKNQDGTQIRESKVLHVEIHGK